MSTTVQKEYKVEKEKESKKEKTSNYIRKREDHKINSR